jgi:hypothetical protein
MDDTIARGTVRAAPLISSDIYQPVSISQSQSERVPSRLTCIAPSAPTKGAATPSRPTKNAKPIVGQPELLKAVHISLEGVLGDSRSKGMMIAKKPRIWTMRIDDSIAGKTLLKTVLMHKVSKTTAQYNSVPCQPMRDRFG